ncbi:MAG TPA: hypothetical protein VJ505_11230 [Holophagaceae bacterium]|nr:hypothetical protein [Holophagaceae bacterium]
MKSAVLEPTLEAYEAIEERKFRVTRSGPIVIPHPIPIPLPLLQGSRFLIWKQDPSVGEPGLRIHYVPTYTYSGPKDARITTELPGTTPVSKNAQGDFIFALNSPELDCAHTFAIVRDTLTMYQRVRGGAQIPWAWNVGGNTDTLVAYPRAGVTANAYYSRAQKSLKFFYFTPTGASAPVYTCRSLDIVAHETGHAVLDGLKPGWLAGGNPPQTGGLHESFGDLTAIFLALSQLDQVEAAIALTKANLHDKNFLAALAEQFGSALGLPQGLRNADNDLKLSQVGNEVHAISQVFTGGIYDVLADIFAFEKNRQAGVKDPARVLLEVGAHLCKLLITAIEAAPASAATYADVVNQMLVASHAAGDPVVYRTYIRNRFTYREVVVSPTPLTSHAQGRMSYTDPSFVEGEDLLKMTAHKHDADHAPQNRAACCGTMQRTEFMLADAKLMLTGKALTEEDRLNKDRAEIAKAFK